MRTTFLTALAAVTVLSYGVFASRAEAVTAARPSTHGVASHGGASHGVASLDGTSASLVREAAIVCGGNGCNPVHTKAQQKRKFQTLGHG